jgi:cbb3-type cytochrome oxidase maturation protein
MTILLVLIPIALSLGLVGLSTFLWSVRDGQFDDLDGAATRILFDDNPQPGSAPGSGPKQTIDDHINP